MYDKIIRISFCVFWAVRNRFGWTASTDRIIMEILNVPSSSSSSSSALHHY